MLRPAAGNVQDIVSGVYIRALQSKPRPNEHDHSDAVIQSFIIQPLEA